MEGMPCTIRQVKTSRPVMSFHDSCGREAKNGSATPWLEGGIGVNLAVGDTHGFPST